MTRAHFNALNNPRGALLVGSPEYVAEKILAHSEALGGIDRVTFNMDNAGLSQSKLLKAIEFLGTRVAPLIH